MAFNILVELPSPNWESLNKKILEYSGLGIEFFPIPAGNNIHIDHLGISIINSKMNESRVAALKAVLVYLLECRSAIFELYSSSQISTENMELFLGKYFV
jgi:hypothetical protein